MMNTTSELERKVEQMAAHLAAQRKRRKHLSSVRCRGERGRTYGGAAVSMLRVERVSGARVPICQRRHLSGGTSSRLVPR